MVVGHVDGPGAQLHALGGIHQRRQEQGGRGDVLFRIGGVLAHVAFGIAEFVGQDEGLPVFAQGLLPILADRVHGHGEKAEFHEVSFDKK